MTRIEQLFPPCEQPLKPVGSLVLLQQLKVPDKIGTIIRPEITKDREEYLNGFGRVMALGDQCFRDTFTGKMIGDPWFEVGDIVKLQPHSSDRMTLRSGIIFRLVSFTEIEAVVPPDSELIANL